MNSFYFNSLGQTYLSKIEALSSKSPVFLYYFDDRFTKYNWKKEPSESLKELYKRRAQHLRDTYDYLILAYSGGVDSTNILETFYYNQITLDEIIMVGAFSRDSHTGSDENHNKEIYDNCFETLKTLNLKNTKIQVLDYTLNTNYSLVNQDDWYHKVGAWFSIHHWFWYDLDRLYSKDKKIGLILGLDKPNLSIHNNKAYFNFSDLCLNSYGSTLSRYNNLYGLDRINFYWSPDAADIIIKQCHMINNLYRENRLTRFNYQERLFGEIIYKLNNPLTHVSPKSQTRLLSLRDGYVRTKSDFKELEIFKTYASGISKLKNPLYGQPIFSRKYFIE